MLLLHVPLVPPGAFQITYIIHNINTWHYDARKPPEFFSLTKINEIDSNKFFCASSSRY